jgi:ribonuclease I
MTFPHGTAPQPRQFVVWAKRFSDDQIEQAFIKASRKFASQDTEPNTIQRYVTGLLLNLEREREVVTP